MTKNRSPDALAVAAGAMAPTTGTAEPKPPANSHEALALKFAAKHVDRLRYVAAWDRWCEWDGNRWRVDDTLLAFDFARFICREAGARCNDPREAVALASASTVAAIVRLAKADRKLAATVDQWDADPWLLNTPSGAVDLRTGKKRACQREDYCTKITAVAPGGSCPRWLAFLARITNGDAELVAFLKRMSGYFLTGETREHALFFSHGTGANGKSVFVNTVAGILGDYALAAPMETFVASNFDRHPTELAGLRGARLVTAQETEEGRRWNESRIKALTGGDKIPARFMRQDFFEYVPQFKLFIVGNHKPALCSVNEAVRRRFNLIPFTVTIPEEERDERLVETLRAEWPGILQWMIDGCLAWQKDGLAQPDAVRTATADYLEAEDATVQWVSERCSLKSGHFTLTADLYRDWRAWAETAGEPAGSEKRFSQALQDRGLVKRREPGTGRMGYQGVALRENDAA